MLCTLIIDSRHTTYKFSRRLFLRAGFAALCMLICKVTHVIVAVGGGDRSVTCFPFIRNSDRLGSFLLDGLGVIQKCQLVEFLDICNTSTNNTLTTAKNDTVRTPRIFAPSLTDAFFSQDEMKWHYHRYSSKVLL